MRPATDRASGRPVRWAVLAILAVVLAACGASVSPPPVSAPTTAASGAPATATAAAPSAPASEAPSAPPSVAPSPAPSKGPATATVALTGTAGLTAAVTPTEIVCGQPGFDGPQIFVIGKVGTAGVQVVLFITDGHVEARVATGSGTTLRLRSFVGTGVTGFVATTGAQIDTKLTESTPAGSLIGKLGVLSAISGSVDCGDEQQGSANVVVSGPTPLGAIDGAITGVHVTCTVTSSGTYVGVQGFGMAGTTPVLVFVTAGATSLQVAVETRTAGSFYLTQASGLVTLTADGASMAGDVTQQGVKAGVTPLVLHVSGDATCGATVHV